MRIIEFKTLGYNTHSVFPSAAVSLMGSNHFTPSNPTIIFVHGFTDNPLSVVGRSIADAYKRHGKYNVLALDASKLIESLYLRSVTAAKYIGEYLGYFIFDLNRAGVNTESIHVIGHSLGAHIAGFAGKSYQILKSGERLPRITGLDPAGPCFDGLDASQRLDYSDARFVDIIHTNIGVYGLNKSIGSVDFYPNGGGMEQPGCGRDISCSHARAWQFYVESIDEQENFIAVECDSWDSFLSHKCTNNKRAVMGFATSNTTTGGNFFLKARAYSKYGLRNSGIE